MATAPAGPEAYTLPPLPYKSLEPAIDDATLALHHDKHHAGYVKGANAALEALAKARDAGDFGLVKHWERELAFHASGHVLHALYWTSLWPGGRGEPSAALAQAMEASFGSKEKMLAQFAAATKAVEASGWGVLAGGEAPGPDGLGRYPHPRLRRLGTRLLPEVPEQSRGVRGRGPGDPGLAIGLGTIRASDEVTP